MIIVRAYLEDGSFKSVVVNKSTTVKEFIQLVLEKIETIAPDKNEDTTVIKVPDIMYEEKDGKCWPLDLSKKVLEIQAKWPKTSNCRFFFGFSILPSNLTNLAPVTTATAPPTSYKPIFIPYAPIPTSKMPNLRSSVSSSTPLGSTAIYVTPISSLSSSAPILTQNPIFNITLPPSPSLNPSLPLRSPSSETLTFLTSGGTATGDQKDTLASKKDHATNVETSTTKAGSEKDKEVPIETSPPSNAITSVLSTSKNDTTHQPIHPSHTAVGLKIMEEDESSSSESESEGVEEEAPVIIVEQISSAERVIIKDRPLVNVDSFSYIEKQKILKSQRACKRWYGKHKLAQLAKNVILRAVVISELYNTEQCYIDALKTLVEEAYRPYSDNFQALKHTRQDVDTIFSNCFELFTHHQIMWESMNKAFRNIQNINESLQIKVTLVFKDMANRLKRYMAYSANQPKSLEHFESMKKKSPNFARFVMETESQEKLKGLPLLYYLNLPMHKFAHYYNLFQEYVKNSPSGFPGYDESRAVLSSLDAVKNVSSGEFKLDSFQKMRKEGILSISRNDTFELCYVIVLGSSLVLSFKSKSIRDQKILKEWLASGKSTLFNNTQNTTTNTTLSHNTYHTIPSPSLMPRYFSFSQPVVVHGTRIKEIISNIDSFTIKLNGGESLIFKGSEKELWIDTIRGIMNNPSNIFTDLYSLPNTNTTNTQTSSTG